MEPNHIDQIKQAFQKKTANIPSLTPEQEKQILHQIIQERIAPQPQQGSGAAVSNDDNTATQESDAVQATAPASQPKQAQSAAVPQHIQDTVKTLVDMAVKEDLYKATKMAYETKNPFLIDQYHDTLVNEFYQLIKLQEQES